MSRKTISSHDFNIAVNMVAKGKYTDFLKEINSEMGWAEKTIYNKTKGISPLTKPQTIVARKVLRKYGVDVDTLKYI